ncbi:MAG TPA: alpha-hydroxy acid oxidase [Solirubrobacteraceae bacterium]|nr:alpha-hydroxy acid oxidase [Solirubrobacteraceae bacterium]
MPHDFGSTATTHAIIDAARANLADDVWDYIAGAAESETTARRNRLGIDSLVLRPRVGRDVSVVDPSTSLLGHRLRIPVVLAPIGALEAITPDGGIATARAAERFGTLAVISSVTEPSFEEVAAATAAPLISQLYIRGDPEWCEELIGRVVASGYAAIALTVDSAHYGRRERQLQTGWRPPTHRDGLPEPGIVWQARLTWDRLEAMREQSGVPAIVKGVQSGRDAEIAVDRGFEVVWVSNHGGRDLDHGDATIESLREVVDAVGGRAEIVVDGGFLRGTDVLKAIALGATAVAVGRLEALALAAGGEVALVRVLEILEEEISVAMALLGVKSVAELDETYVRRAQALPAASPLLAAFPERAHDWPRPDANTP